MIIYGYPININRLLKILRTRSFLKKNILLVLFLLMFVLLGCKSIEFDPKTSLIKYTFKGINKK